MGQQRFTRFGYEFEEADPESTFTSELDFDETVVWSGRPHSLVGVAMKAVPQGLFGLAFVAFTLYWMATVVQGNRNNWDRGRVVPPFADHNIVIAASCGLFLLPPGIALLLATYGEWRRADGLHYLLTNRRVIIAQAGRVHVLSFTPGALRGMKATERRDGSGDLVFGTRPTMVNGMTQSVGFLAIEDVRAVEALVRKTLRPG
jgi:hypothetical protein